MLSPMQQRLASIGAAVAAAIGAFWLGACYGEAHARIATWQAVHVFVNGARHVVDHNLTLDDCLRLQQRRSVECERMEQ